MRDISGKEDDNTDANASDKSKIYLTIAMAMAIIVAVAAIGITLFFNSTKQGSNPVPTGKFYFSDAIGKEAPDFSLMSINGQTVKLSDYKGKNVVLFFNEGGMCYPSCWNQIAEFGNDERFNTNDTIAFSIVVEPKSKWDNIIQQAPQLSESKILFDTTRTASSAYDVLSLPSSMHKGSYPGHTYFVIDKQGIIRYAHDDPSMGIRNDLIFTEIEKLG